MGDIHRVIIETDADPNAVYDLIRGAKQLGVRVSLVPGVFEVIGTSVEIDELAGMIMLGLRPFGLSRSSKLLKRALDVVASALALIAIAPLLCVLAVAIKLDSPGPVLFRQTRVGRGGRPFQILKFRTMDADAELRKRQLTDRNESEGLFKIADDPRITRVGRVLRRTSMDELPQLVNVLAGSMSLVGPRPLVLDEDVKITGWDRRRLLLTPGMTGPWQIAGSARIPLADMVKIDYRYIGGWSLWSDCKILLRTIPYALARRGL
jgi:exopolysaccharide biosynthesis polyprenyl glycosylphosphotransferase